MNKLYAAPMEGLTGYLWRQVHAALFGPADKYFTPFLSPNATRTFQRKELDEIDPAHNAGLYVVPQLLTNRAEHFLWAAGELYARGYREINFNLGCPAGTVAAKRKGSGLLAYPQELDHCLEEIFAGLPRGMSVSVKTRIGKNAPATPGSRRSFTRASPTGTPGPPYPAPGRRCITATFSRRRTPPPCAGIIPERTRRCWAGA